MARVAVPLVPIRVAGSRVGNAWDWNPPSAPAVGHARNWKINNKHDCPLVRRLSSQRDAQNDHSSDGGQAGTHLAFEQHLRQERPQSDRRRVNVVLVMRKGGIGIDKSLLDALLGQHVGKGQTVVLQE